MRLIKRRSTPVIEHDPLPASISLVDLGGPGVASTSTTLSTPPSLYQRHSDLDVRLPYRLPHSHSHSNAAPTSTPPRSCPKVDDYLGTDCSIADAHTSRTGKWNVLTASASSASAKEADEDPRRSGEFSPRDGPNETIVGNKRESGGQNRYPPNSLVPGTGWGFGLMRRSRKQDMTVVPPLPLRMNSLS